MGDNETTEFYFNFPYFENTNIKVTKNNQPATSYTVVGTSAGLDADIPYTGGKIVFDTAPTEFDSITIARSLPLSRIVDYQPTAKIEPTVLNQDMNYMIEVLKDLQDELDDFHAQYADIIDHETTTTVLARISAIHDEIENVLQEIDNLGDISTITSNISSLQQSVSTLTTTTGNHTTSIGTLDNRTTGIIDYVIETQTPTAQNNYTWYRKYKSGWVEQGGYIASGGGGIAVTLPVTMADANYQIILTGKHDSNTAGSTTSVSVRQGNHPVQTTGFYVNNYVENGGNRGDGDAFWWMCFGFYDTTI